MKEDVKTRWVAALLSGEYTQGTGALNRNGRHCCLGVLCEVLGVPSRVVNGLPGTRAYGNSRATLPRAAMRLSGVKTQCGGYADDADELTTANDAGVSFEEIAAIVEANWKQL